MDRGDRKLNFRVSWRWWGAATFIIAVLAGSVVVIRSPSSKEYFSDAEFKRESPSSETTGRETDESSFPNRGVDLQGIELQDSERIEAEWFKEITTDVSLDFTHETGPTGFRELPEINGSGAALFDFDNDKDLDIYLTSGHREFPRESTAKDPVHRLYRQDPGGEYVDVTAESGLGDGGYGMGVAIGDIDNDGNVDLYVANYGADRLYRNCGNGTFKDVTATAGINIIGWSSSTTFFDYDRDGFLDLYVVQYVDYDPKKRCFDHAGRLEYCGPLEFPPSHDHLLHNNGDGTFTDVSEAAGITSIAAAGLGVVCEDLNDDGWIDVYVANDAYANHLWINQGNGTFQDDALILGAAYNLHGQPEAGMGVVAADIDNDTDFDLFITHLIEESNTLYRNLGMGRGFEDVTGESGLAGSSIVYTGFGTAALDIEHDGDLDLVVLNGRVRQGKPVENVYLSPPWNLYAEPNLVYQNDGTGHFSVVRAPVASLCQTSEVSRGLAVGDIDCDGDIDLLISNLHGRARLYRNDTTRKGHWLGVRAVDPRLKRQAIGARVTVFAGDRRLVRTINRGFSYLSSSDPLAHFGLGDSDKINHIEVWWPDGLRELFPGVSGDRTIVLLRGTGQSRR